MARLERRLGRLEEPPGAHVTGRALEYLTDGELHLIIAYGRCAAEAGSRGARPTPKEEAALTRYQVLCDDIREGWIW